VGRLKLGGFLDQAARTPFVWGGLAGQDCMIFVADWALLRTGRDPAARWRGSYDSEAGAGLILDALGGLVPLLDEGLGADGWVSTADPVSGDIGAVEVRAVDGRAALAGAVRTGGLWAVKAQSGLGLIRAAPAAAWTWPER